MQLEFYKSKDVYFVSVGIFKGYNYLDRHTIDSYCFEKRKDAITFLKFRSISDRLHGE